MRCRGGKGLSGPEVLALEGLAELPVGGDDVPGGGGPAVAAGDTEGQGLADEDGVGLPVLAPVAGHGHPPRAGPLHAGAHDVAGARHVGDQHQVEVLEPVDGEPDPSRPPARHPAAPDISVNTCHSKILLLMRPISGGGWVEVEVGAGRIAPPAIVRGERVVGRAEVGSRDEDGGAPSVAPLRIARALDLEARPAALPLVEQRRAQSRRLHPVPLAVQVPIPTRPSCTPTNHSERISFSLSRWVLYATDQ
ncbi:hypothetical protein BHE74_00030452 [Ensete ventricosum]|nr:hypothetical protein BHE74_00030452 [Ensete ventricosum]